MPGQILATGHCLTNVLNLAGDTWQLVTTWHQPRIHQSRRDRIWAAFRILAAFHLLKLGLKFEMRPKCGLGVTDESEAGCQFNRIFSARELAPKWA